MSSSDSWKVTVAGTDAEAKRLDAIAQASRPDHLRKAENAAEANKRLIYILVLVVLVVALILLLILA